MKKIFKFGCLSFIALIIIIVIIAIASGDDETTQDSNTEKEPTPTQESGTNEDIKKGTTDKEGVLTEEKFNQIQNGMTYEKVAAIIGTEGTVMSESGEVGSQFHTVIYEWETDGLFSAANFMFQGGKLINKSQMGVTENSDATITLAEFNQLQNGMTYEEVAAIIGGEGNIISETGEKGIEFYTVMYEYKGEGDFGANANFMFQGGKLQNKAQFGLK